LKPKNPTFSDVARVAGVSVATVSRVASHAAFVSPEVERRVRAAAESVGVSLEKRNGSRLIAFILGNRSLLHPFHSHVLTAAEAYCADKDYNLVFFPLHYSANVPSTQLHVPRIFERGDLIDGLIVSGVNSANLFEVLQQVRRPFAVYGDTVEGPWAPGDYDVVWVDDITGAYDLTRFLRNEGHSRIWYVANTRQTWFARRLEGYAAAMKEGGAEPLISSVDSHSEHEVGLLGTKDVLRRGHPVDAIFGGSDAVCHGVYTALRDAGLSVPKDVSVVGFNDTPEANLLHPALTTVRAFPAILGRMLAAMVMSRISNPGLPPQDRVISTQVIKRESSRSCGSSHSSQAPKGLGMPERTW
jgi:DNA-binding LacI/PurR family transcriptional regulator